MYKQPILLVSLLYLLFNSFNAHPTYTDYDNKIIQGTNYMKDYKHERTREVYNVLDENVGKDKLLNGRAYDYDQLLSSTSRLPLHEDDNERDNFIDENLNELEDENGFLYNQNEQDTIPKERENYKYHDDNGKLYFGKGELSAEETYAEHEMDHVELSKHNNFNNINASAVKQPLAEMKVLQMPSVAPQEMDSYLCYGFELPADDHYITEFSPLAEMQIAHHMLLFGCEVPYKKNGVWDCREMQPVCASGIQRIMYAWAKNAPALKMPDNVGFHVGKNSGVNYLVLQVHYLHVDKFKDGAKDESGLKFLLTQQRKRFLAGILLLADGWTVIPPHKKKAHIDMGCEYDTRAPIIYPFRFRTHAHKLGVVITGYRVRDGKWTLIGRGDPQRPQAFYRAFEDLDVKPGDKLYGRCTYNSMSKDTVTHIGATHNDEMCNFYLMYYYDSYKGSESKMQCQPLSTTDVVYPKNSDTALAVMEARNNKKRLFEVAHGWPSPKHNDGDLTSIGQIAGVAYDNNNGYVLIFHRGERTWDEETFDEYNNLHEKYKTTIPQKTLIWLDRVTGKIIKSAGERMFNIPHGVTIDDDGNIWVTDVGAHQVFKLSPDLDEKTNNVKVLLAVGERFVNGNDSKHFCKPTDVAVMKDGSFFVADGYCNSRVIKFDAKGNALMEISESSFDEIYSFPKPKYMVVVHSLALDEESNRLFVADRENGRILIFNPETGEFISHISRQFDNGAVYALAYNPHDGGVLHVVNGALGFQPVHPSGFTWSLTENKIISKWEPEQGLGTPHDIAVSANNRFIFVSEIRPNKIWKFKSTKYLRP